MTDILEFGSVREKLDKPEILRAHFRLLAECARSLILDRVRALRASRDMQLYRFMQHIRIPGSAIRERYGLSGATAHERPSFQLPEPGISALRTLCGRFCGTYGIM